MALAAPVRQWLRQQAPAQYEQMQTWRDAQVNPCCAASTPPTGSLEAPTTMRLRNGWRGRAGRVRQGLRNDGALIGLIADLAVGCAPQASRRGPAATNCCRVLNWARRRMRSTAGPGLGYHQLVTFALQREGFEPFIRVLRAVMAGRWAASTISLACSACGCFAGRAPGRAFTCAIRSMI